jgi:hypothetical protein
MRNKAIARARFHAFVLAPVLMGGCLAAPGGQPAEKTSSTMVAGKAALGTFPETPAKARVVGPLAATVAEAPLAADGSFVLQVPAGNGYQLELVSAGATYGLVLPRGEGKVDSRFAVRGERDPFQLGDVRFVGDAKATPFAVHHAGPAGDDVPTACAEGLDPVTGAPLVDDAEAALDTCGFDIETTTSVGCEDGTDVATGEPCGAAVPADALPKQAAVATHNLPPALGCTGAPVASLQN